MKWILAIGMITGLSIMAPRGVVPCDQISEDGTCSASSEGGGESSDSGDVETVAE